MTLFPEVVHRHDNYTCYNAPISIMSSSKTQQVEGFTHMRKTSEVFSHQRPEWYVSKEQKIPLALSG